LSEVVKMRTSNVKFRVVRAAAALPEITPEAGRSRAVRELSSPEEGLSREQRLARSQQDEVDALCRTEHQRGFVEGKYSIAEQLENDYAAKLEAERNRIDGIINGVREQFSALYASSEEAIVKFAFGVAGRIIRREVSLDRSLVLGQIRESVRRVLGVERLTIRVHPGDLAAVREQKSVIQANGDSIREIIVEGDESLEPGDCVLESDMGNIDARLSTQLKQIENVLFDSKVVS
jgi:flagellar assembly protein FliH